MLERTAAIAKPGMALYAPEDLETLLELDEAPHGAAQDAYADNAIAVVTARGRRSARSARPRPAYAKSEAVKYAEDVEKAGLLLTEIEKELARHHGPPRPREHRGPRAAQQADGGARAPPTAREPRLAMAGGSGKQEIDYLIKKAWLEQHNADPAAQQGRGLAARF